MSRTLAVKALIVVMLAMVVSGSVFAGALLRPGEKVPGGGHHFGGDLDATEFGIGAVITAGSEKRPVDVLTVITRNGMTLAPNMGVISACPGDCLKFQLYPNGATAKNQYDFWYTLMALSSPDNMFPATFDPINGWQFTVNVDWVGVRRVGLLTSAHGAKKNFVRLIFKFTYKSSSLALHDQLVIESGNRSASGGYAPGQVSDSGNWKKVADNFAAQNQFNQGVAAKVNNLDQRVGNLEGWATSASRPPAGQIVTGSRIDYRFHISVGGQEFSGKVWLKTFSQKTPQGRVDICTGPWIPLSGALPGCYRVDCSYDGSSWKSLEYTVTASGQIVELAF